LAESRKAQVDEVFRSGSPVRFEDEREGRFFDHRLYPVFGAQGEVTRIAVYIHDITHRKQAEERIRVYQERLRSLASQLSLVEERERRRLATALHDRIAQTLALSKMKLGALQEPVSSTDLAQSLDEIYRLIEQTIQDTRSLIFEISSPILYHFGLEAAVEWLTEQTQKQHGIPSEFRDDRQPKPLDEDVRILLFQAVRELLVNVAKHAQAQSVKVAIRRDGSDIQIIVEDDGVGFDAFPIGSHWSEIKGFGLFSIRERLDHLGGQLKIKSEPGHGTQVTLVAPLKREETSEEEMA
jgi:signal transduction histidine kinase